MPNKYSTSNVKLADGGVVDVSKRVFIPKEDKNGFFKTSDGAMYHRDAKGTIRRVITK
jgi:hypothetical protein